MPNGNRADGLGESPRWGMILIFFDSLLRFLRAPL